MWSDRKALTPKTATHILHFFLLLRRNKLVKSSATNNCIGKSTTPHTHTLRKSKNVFRTASHVSPSEENGINSDYFVAISMLSCNQVFL